jgi:hypothetical protein
MSYARTLARQIDADLIERMEASGKPESRRASVTKTTPRPAGSYRGSRRNEARISKKPMLTYAELRRINAMHAQRNQPKGDHP